MGTRGNNSLETILTLDNRDAESEWSVVWSTSHVPGMDGATGGQNSRHRRKHGRRDLRIGAFVLGSFLTMHCRVIASALSGGFFVFILLLVPAVMLLANPLRHFEVYLGQWSISGPGRAFRIVPMLDGVGLAICINAILRAICCGTLAAIAAVYVLEGLGDGGLPVTYCRRFDLTTYQPVWKNVTLLEDLFRERYGEDIEPVTVGTTVHGWTNITGMRFSPRANEPRVLLVCNETFSEEYPVHFATPAYNYFYVEVMKMQSDYRFGTFNTTLIWNIVIVWLFIWMVLVSERLKYGRLIFNNMYMWIAVIPWIWTVVVMVTGVVGFFITQKSYRKFFRLGSKEVLSGISDAFESALYIHAASVGTEIIHGKGLNHYAGGHIDPHLNSENVWHSGILLLLTVLNSGGAAVCALVDYKYPSLQSFDRVIESTLFVFPLYSKCTSVGEYSRLKTTLVFSGLVFSYTVVAFYFLKSALHTIFEYRVKLVFVEQYVVAGLMISCIGLSLLFATNGGLPLLESVDCMLSGIAMPFVCLLELVTLMYVYRSSDFISDMNVATEDNTCSTRISLQWQIIPVITVVLMLIKIVVLTSSEFPAVYVYAAIAPVMAVVIAVPCRAIHNAYSFLHRKLIARH